MRLLARAWITWARIRQRRAWRRVPPREELVRRYAPDRSFADVGAIWQVDGRIAFLAEACGARSVTAIDLMAPTAAYAGEHERRRSRVRFVQGDLHDPDVVQEIGPHQVVWCSGVLYHSPNPLLALERLHSITEEVLILATETLPEIPGIAQASVFWPGLPERDRRVHAAARPNGTALGIDTPFEREQSYGAWWWGTTRSALRGMLGAAGFTIVEERGGPLHVTVVAVPSG